VGSLVILVLGFIYFDGHGKILAFVRPSKPVSDDSIFTTVRGVKEKVDDVDYEQLIEELNSWTGTFKKLGRVLRLPVTVVTSIFSSLSFFNFKDRNDKDDILNGDFIGKDDSSLQDDIREQSTYKFHDHDKEYKIDIDDIKDIINDFSNDDFSND